MSVYPESWFKKKFKVAENGCWLWTASQDERGRGQVRMLDGKVRRAHIVSWLMYKGELPVGAHVLHQCDNPNCVNPEHLFLGNQDINMKDAAFKGRHAKKLTNEQAEEVARLWATGKYKSYRELGRLFGVQHGSIQWAIEKRQHGSSV